MKNKLYIALGIIFILIVVFVIILFNLENKKNIDLPTHEEKIYDKSAICYSSNLGSTVLNVKGNDKETVIEGLAIKKDSTPAWVNDKLGDYNYDSVLANVNDILDKQTDNKYSLNIEELDSNKSSYRDDTSSYDEYWYKITFDYIENNSFDDMIDILENSDDYYTNYYCIINDGISYPGKWEGIGQYTLDTDYDITVILNDKQGGSFKAVKKSGVQTTFEKFIKYNVLGNKIKVVYYELKDINGYQYVRFISSDEYTVDGNTIKFHLWRDELLNKVG